MDKWDDERLKEVIGQKGNSATTTDIVCKVREASHALRSLTRRAALYRCGGERSVWMVLGMSRWR